MKKANFDKFLAEQIKEPACASGFRNASAEWE
jgi:hypothetical protein